MIPNPEINWEDIDKQVEKYALTAIDRPPKFYFTERMKNLNKGMMSYPEQEALNESQIKNEAGYVWRCIKTSNYRMLFAFMNASGYNQLSFEMISQIPIAGIISMFPQGCFSNMSIPSIPPNYLVIVEWIVIYLWLHQPINFFLKPLLLSVKTHEIDVIVNLISKMEDLKRNPLLVITEILKSKIYHDVIINELVGDYRNPKFPNRDIRNDLIRIINSLLQVLNPYLNFYDENVATSRVAFLPWSLSVMDFKYFSEYDRQLEPFRNGLFDFGPIPRWSKSIHSKYPVNFKRQVKTILLMKNRKGNIINRLFHKDLLSKLFQYMSFNSLMVEKKEIIDKDASVINRISIEKFSKYGKFHRTFPQNN